MNHIVPILLLAFLIGCTPMSTSSPTPPPPTTTPLPPTATATVQVQADIFALNQKLRRTVNLGNALEAPNEGDWGVVLQADYFQKIAAAGFTAVRIPIRFSAHAPDSAPYSLDPTFIARVDWAVNNAISNGLVAIVDMHHYLEMFSAPSENQARFLGLWQQIAEHYQDYPDDQLYFELLNEPNGALTDAIWNDILAEAIPLIRKTNPTRPIIVGASGWNSFEDLANLRLPEDSNVIATFHYYLPFQFTHQGAEWVDASNAWMGTLWNGKPDELAAIAHDFDIAASWAAKHNRPLLLGEFGAYSKADQASRVRWTAAVRQAAEERGFSWAYWEFCSGFGLYDRDASQWRQDLLGALIPTP